MRRAFGFPARYVHIPLDRLVFLLMQTTLDLRLSLLE